MENVNEHIEFMILLDKFFRETPRKEIETLISKYDRMKCNGPTVKEYLQNLED